MKYYSYYFRIAIISRLIYNFALAERRKEWELKNLRENFEVFPWDFSVQRWNHAINTQGKFYEATNPRPDKYWNPIVDSLQSRRDHCKKKSRKHAHIHQSMTKRMRKRSNQIKDIQHKLSRKMINNTKANRNR